ncbi:HNH endonuclease [Geothrix edaphica]|jgi:putative restriction endonuclease|uniref:Restriction endonuclease n=1 Tax=Geothrix edaphica TaxID=2927976 RepID=A0ABQ5PU41_9BACT|nr:HNH endonuclease [Geothrix edaphica]GLH65883.1 restriction endonuclease [Geothrix edaphica]
MANAVLTTSVGSIYDDLPEFRYHFPRTYLNQVQAAVGDWVVYYEPRRSHGGGRQAYFAMARVLRVEPDPNLRDHFYAYMDGYLEFEQPVGFQGAGRYWESTLQKSDGTTNRGAFGRAVRLLPEAEFEAIVQAGYQRNLEPWEAMDVALAQGVAEETFAYDARPMVEQWVTRPFREEAFRRKVREAYKNTCAFSGLCLVNGGGRPEVQAAHIRPVASSGPDSVRNGLALTGTLHWLFDRGLLAVGEDLEILVSPQGVPDGLSRLLRPDRRLVVPDAPDSRPHAVFLAWHRENVFKG